MHVFEQKGRPQTREYTDWRWPLSRIHSVVIVFSAQLSDDALQTRSDLYIPRNDRDAYFVAAKQADRSWEYINRSQMHECRNWNELQNRRTDRGNILIAHRYMNVGTGTRPRSFISRNICFEFSLHFVWMPTSLHFFYPTALWTRPKHDVHFEDFLLTHIWRVFCLSAHG